MVVCPFLGIRRIAQDGISPLSAGRGREVHVEVGTKGGPAGFVRVDETRRRQVFREGLEAGVRTSNGRGKNMKLYSAGKLFVDRIPLLLLTTKNGPTGKANGTTWKDPA